MSTSLTKEQQEVAKTIRINIKKNLDKEIAELVEKYSKQLTDELTSKNVLPPSYLANGEEEWDNEDSRGFVMGNLIEVLIRDEPSEDWDGYNRWDKFEELEFEDC